MSRRGVELASAFLADAVLGGIVAAILAIWDAPTWGWLAAGLIVFMVWRAGNYSRG